MHSSIYLCTYVVVIIFLTYNYQTYATLLLQSCSKSNPKSNAKKASYYLIIRILQHPHSYRILYAGPTRLCFYIFQCFNQAFTFILPYIISMTRLRSNSFC